MKKVQDNFSKQSGIYKKYRPTYPKELYDDLFKLTQARNECWDCGTGNGQVATELSKHFNNVYATDISEPQISNADQRNNIVYKVERVENTSFKDNQFDLVTVAQAIHWFDIPEFNKEIKRVTKNGGLVCIWGYGLLKIEKTLDDIIDQFYNEIVGPYWNLERKYIDDAYASINLDFKEITLIKEYSINVKWSLEELEGFFNSWSSVQNYINANGENPVQWIMSRVNKYWENGTTKEIRFPIFTRIGKVEK